MSVRELTDFNFGEQAGWGLEPAIEAVKLPVP